MEFYNGDERMKINGDERMEFYDRMIKWIL